MANSTLTALTAATTPLTGTEVLYGVQSSTDVKITAASLMTPGPSAAAQDVTTTNPSYTGRNSIDLTATANAGISAIIVTSPVPSDSQIIYLRNTCAYQISLSIPNTTGAYGFIAPTGDATLTSPTSYSMRPNEMLPVRYDATALSFYLIGQPGTSVTVEYLGASTSTLTFPQNAKSVRVQMRGGSSSASTGVWAAAGVIAPGGGGGAGGGFVDVTIPCNALSGLTATLTIGAAAAAVTTQSTAGNPGSNTTFSYTDTSARSIVLIAGGGGAPTAGTAGGPGTGGTGGTGMVPGGNGGNGADGAGGAATVGQDAQGLGGAAGGGGGGAQSVANTSYAGANGGKATSLATVGGVQLAGGAGSSGGAAGGAGDKLLPALLGSSGGGGASPKAALQSQTYNGGVGSSGSGGGGGSGLHTSSTGKSGSAAGSPGYACITVLG